MYLITAIKQTTTISINVFNNSTTDYNDNCQTCDTVNLLSKSVIGLQKINKKNKMHFGGRLTSLRSDSYLPKNLFICFNDSPSKIMKNGFYFILKALFFFKIFKFSSTFWAYRKNGLMRKISLISTFMTSQSG